MNIKNLHIKSVSIGIDGVLTKVEMYYKKHFYFLPGTTPYTGFIDEGSLQGEIINGCKEGIWNEKYESDLVNDVIEEYGLYKHGCKEDKWISYYSNRQIMAAANGGVMSETRLKSVYDVIYNEKNQEMSKSEIDPETGKEIDRIGSDILDPEFNLLRFSKDISDIRRVSEAVNNSEPENIVALENLTPTRARALVEKLKEVKINEEGELLTENNFDDFHVDLQKKMVENGANTIVSAIKDSARRLGLTIEGADEDFNLDRQTLRIQDIEGDFNRLGENHGAIVEYQTLVNLLKAHGYVSNIRAVEGKDGRQYGRPHPPGTHLLRKDF